MEIIAPLTSPDCDLRDFAFMPLDVVRLRDSDLAAMESPEACWSAVLLWCASWHQIPAASLPDDDRVLANLAGFGRVVKEWQRVRDGALRGWIKCADGRLYHPVIAEKANEAFIRKLEQGWRTECARIKKLNQRNKTDNPLPTLEEFLSPRTTRQCPQGQRGNVPEDNTAMYPRTTQQCPDDVPKETPSNRQGEGQGQRQRQTEVKEGGDNSQSSTPAASPQTAPPLNPNSETKPTAGEVCKQLMALQVGAVNPGHPLLTMLLEAGATMDEFTGAAKSAVANGKGKFAYVLNTVKGQREDAKAAASTIAVGSIKREKPWFITASGIEAKAKELNITINPKDEAFPQLQVKVFRACGITQEILRKANQDFGAKA